MPRLPLRGLAVGFTAGAAAGWLVGLLRAPADPPDDTGAQAAARMPQENFGEAPVETVAADHAVAPEAPAAAPLDEPVEATVGRADVADAPAVEPAPPAAAVAVPVPAPEPAAPGATEPLAPVKDPKQRVERLDEATTAAFDSAAARPAKRVRKKAAPKTADAAPALDGDGGPAAETKPRRRAPRKALPPTAENTDD